MATLHVKMFVMYKTLYRVALLSYFNFLYLLVFQFACNKSSISQMYLCCKVYKIYWLHWQSCVYDIYHKMHMFVMYEVNIPNSKLTVYRDAQTICVCMFLFFNSHVYFKGFYNILFNYLIPSIYSKMNITEYIL